MTSKYTKEILEEATKNSTSILGVLRFLNVKASGGSCAYIKAKIIAFNIDYSHFLGQGWHKGNRSPIRKTAEQILIVLPEGSARPKVIQLRRALLESGIEEKCICGITNLWNNQPILLEIDHIDGNWLNNLKTNLRFLCPNCHSQQLTSNSSWKTKSML